MPGLRLARKLGIVAVIIGALLGVGGLKFVRDAYPADPFKSSALENCLAADHGFVRYFPEERARCYARQPQMTGYAQAQQQN